MIIEEKINLQLSKMSQQHKKIYKKRIIVENLFATIKAIPRFNSRYDKYIKNMYGYLYLMFMEQIMNFIYII